MAAWGGTCVSEGVERSELWACWKTENWNQLPLLKLTATNKRKKWCWRGRRNRKKIGIAIEGNRNRKKRRRTLFVLQPSVLLLLPLLAEMNGESGKEVDSTWKGKTWSTEFQFQHHKGVSKGGSETERQ